MLELYKKYKEMILYVIFGVLTTLINFEVYGWMFERGGFSNMTSNVIAWILSVLFAYITNKLFVFESREFAVKVLLSEIFSFFLCRLATGLMDMAIMWLFVDVDFLGWSGFRISFDIGPLKIDFPYHRIIKLASNVVVIILNYVASKLIIFKKNEEQ